MGVMTALLPTRADILATAARIAPHIRHTPILTVDAADFGLAGAPISFKLEFLQHSGTFKARGAFNNLLSRAKPGQGVVAASGGNHGAAVAYAAQKLGHPAHIFVPTISSPAKIDRIRSYGAEIVVGGASYVDALAASREWAKAHGRTIIVTLGPDGARAATPTTEISVPAMKVTPVDTVGAGDTFCGYLGAGLDAGMALEAAMRRAAVAASLACLKPGAQPAIPMSDEVTARL